MSDKRFVTPIRLSAHELDALLEELDRNSSMGKQSSKREMRRWSLKAAKAVLTIADPAGAPRHGMIIPRNVSTTGMGCLHTTFIHLGTRCLVSLRDRDGRARSLVGTVMRCKHVRGLLHEVGIKFDDPVHPEDYRDFNNEHVFHREHVDLSKLRGVILTVDDSVLDQKLLAAFFKDSEIEMIFARDGKTALEMLSESPDMVLIDYHLPDMKGTELIGKMSEAGFARPTLIITADVAPAVRNNALQAGACEVLIKPFTAELMHQAAAEYLMGGAGRGAIKSVRESGVVTDALVDEYVAELHKAAYELGALIKQEDHEAVRLRANQLRGSALGYGFKIVSDLADAVGRSLDATHSVAESMGDLRELISVCQRAVPTIAEANAGEEKKKIDKKSDKK